MMTRKDYNKAAAIVRKTFSSVQDGGLTRQAMVYGFVLLFSEDNPRFDVARFKEACKEEK